MDKTEHDHGGLCKKTTLHFEVKRSQSEISHGYLSDEDRHDQSRSSLTVLPFSLHHLRLEADLLTVTLSHIAFNGASFYVTMIGIRN